MVAKLVADYFMSACFLINVVCCLEGEEKATLPIKVPENAKSAEHPEEEKTDKVSEQFEKLNVTDDCKTVKQKCCGDGKTEPAS